MRRTILSVAMLACLCGVLAQSAAAAGTARSTAEGFNQALQTANPAALKPLLPERGRVQLRLIHLGPEEGHFSPSQVIALVRNFLDQGSIRSGKLLSVEQASEGFALAHCRFEITDRIGQRRTIELHLSLQLEDERWLLREIRELPQ